MKYTVCMEHEEFIHGLLEKQRSYFKTGSTLSVKNRIADLKKLKSAIIGMEDEISAALKKDLGKGSTEAFMCEIGLALSEVNYMIKHTRRFARDEKAATPIANFKSRSFVRKSPYGCVLIMSPWNYPFLLSIDPLVDAIAAGNTVVLKPSAYSPATSAVIKKLLDKTFPEEQVAVVEGGRQQNAVLLEQKFDYIFFTGSQNVGKEVLRRAAENLVPATLELGGKSPCIVEKSADINLAARRIVWGKFLNCGQTCVAPDYFLVDESIKDDFVKAVVSEIKKQYGDSPLTNDSYGKIINEKHFERIRGLIDQSKVVHGGKSDAASLKIEPTVMDNVSWDDAVMKEEIFGPIIPVIPYNNLEEIYDRFYSMQKPLAFYFFSRNMKAAQDALTRNSFGGGCINECVTHLIESSMGFGGVGESGMGAYHGKVGFETFSHRKSIVCKSGLIDIKMRYQPFDGMKNMLLRLFLK